MSEIIEVTDYVLVADDSWRDRLAKAKDNLAKRTIPAYIEFCKEVHEFRIHCDSSQGGSEFSRKGCEWLGCDSGTLYRWDAVGRRGDELLGGTHKLPISEHAISLIASLDDVAFPKAIEKLEPGMTQKQVKELIKEVNPPREKSERELFEQQVRTANSLINKFRHLPEATQRTVWQGIMDICLEFD